MGTNPGRPIQTMQEDVVSAPILILVAGEGFEPPTSGL